MKNISFPSRSFLAAAVAALAACAGSAVAQVEFDDFNDDPDSDWIDYAPLDGFDVASSATVVNGAYHLACAASPMPGSIGPARVGSCRPTSYTDFYIAVDLLSWNDSQDLALGILARVSNPGLGTLDGFVFNYNNHDHHMQINRVDGERPTTIAQGNLTLTPGVGYRLVFTAVGSEFTGKVFAKSDLRNPLSTITASSPAHPEGIAGVFVYDRNDPDPAAGSFDNYFSDSVPPPQLEIHLLPSLQVTWPINADGYELQAADSVGPDASWTNVPTEDIGSEGDHYIYEPDPNAPRKFYQLKKNF